VGLTDSDSNSIGTSTARIPFKKKAHNTDPPPIMEGDGRSLKVVGFTQSQRDFFLQILMRLGLAILIGLGSTPNLTKI